MKVYNELITNETERRKYDELVGNVNYLKKIYLIK